MHIYEILLQILIRGRLPLLSKNGMKRESFWLLFPSFVSIPFFLFIHNCTPSLERILFGLFILSCIIVATKETSYLYFSFIYIRKQKNKTTIPIGTDMCILFLKKATILVITNRIFILKLIIYLGILSEVFFIHTLKLGEYVLVVQRMFISA